MRVTLFFVCGVTLLLTTAFHLGYRINLTHSEPTGLYKLASAPLARGDLVAFCLSLENAYTAISAERNYLGTSALCSSGQKPLLKEVVGLAGDSVTVHSSSIQVNDMLFILTSRERDSQGRELPRKLHSVVIPESKALLLSTHHKNSFDSRYFGLVDTSKLRKVIPIFTFN
ncbi:conjugative transfer signal peptidase TraF [Halodesulfovibrio marinisediminis]|uniref:Signal peptidase I n=1 Tax=Halodesulfovibrio marinisediminis DSM 17456 TaxID=1121457 RepID=A0A1N6FDU4_9BACT|nr:conjugative transfer signal peptidase TraF [Halodesulfovibrio marinisediminis]SIN93461.1 signal peptidase I/conjugative transfer signal peptidase TraF,TIGR02771 [Halodesulfovibrio marinisediminis DSM 17456]